MIIVFSDIKLFTCVASSLLGLLGAGSACSTLSLSSDNFELTPIE